MREMSNSRRKLRDELLSALRRNKLELYYQPQVILANRRIVGFEPLIRWNHRTTLLGAYLPQEVSCQLWIKAP